MQNKGAVTGCAIVRRASCREVPPAPVAVDVARRARPERLAQRVGVRAVADELLALRPKADAAVGAIRADTVHPTAPCVALVGAHRPAEPLPVLVRVTVTVQLLRQASLSSLLPSSQASTPAWTIPSPQLAVQSFRRGVGLYGVGVITDLVLTVHEPVTASSHHAGVEAIIGVVGVAVIASLDLLALTVTAPSDGAVVEARAGLDLVTVIAGLNRLDHAVAAAGERAVVSAGVGVVLVAVVASLDPSLNHPITAGRCAAVVEAGVGGVLVAIIACLDPLLREAVAAAGGCARVGARLAVVHVAVVTGFVARVVLTDVRADDPIAAARQRTGVGAGVAVGDVAVNASLKPNEDDAITAASEGAVGATGVGVDLVAVITLLDPLLHDAVPAARRLTGVGARIRCVPVAVITGFTLVDAPVTADFAPTSTVAAVADLNVPVVAFIDPCLHESSAAARRLAGVGAGVGRDQASSSQVSPASTRPFPHDSTRQSLSQPSPASRFPSSQASAPTCRMPSPQRAARHWLVQASVSTSLPSSQVSPASRRPLPQVSLRHPAEQPSPPSRLPSSHSS